MLVILQKVPNTVVTSQCSIALIVLVDDVLLSYVLMQMWHKTMGTIGLNSPYGYKAGRPGLSKYV